MVATFAVLAFSISLAAGEEQKKPATEKENIEALIKHVEELKDAKFIRNDTEYDAKTAAKFLRGKWDNQKSEVKTAKDFIEKCATKSSTSGKAYEIKLKDGKKVKCGEYLSEELKKLEKDPKEKGNFGSISVESGSAPVADAKIVREEGKSPIIIYPPSRKSKKFISTGDVQLAVDDGVEWQGKIAYLALTHTLVVVDAKTEKALWDGNVSAFWNTLTFENLAKANEPAQWVVVLKSSRYPEYSLCYDLNTGKEHPLRGAPPQPPGTVIKPRKEWSGSAGVKSEEVRRLVGSADEWTKLRMEIFGDQLKDIPDASEIDFAQELLLVLYWGDIAMCNGLSTALIVEGDKQIVVRVKRHYYQAGDGNLKEERPYGLVVLPRRPDKPVVLEYNQQKMIGAPPFWKEEARLTRGRQ